MIEQFEHIIHIIPNIQFVQADLIKMLKQHQSHVLIHGCNCFSSMGAGIALYIRQQFPHAYLADKNFPYHPEERLGKFSYWQDNNSCSKSIMVINAYTQYHYNVKNKYYDQKVDLFSYDTFEQQLINIFNFINEKYRFDSQKQQISQISSQDLFDNDLVISMPMIGCGLAGGDVTKIVPMIINAFNQVYSCVERSVVQDGNQHRLHANRLPKLIIAEKKTESFLDFSQKLKNSGLI